MLPSWSPPGVFGGVQAEIVALACLANLGLSKTQGRNADSARGGGRLPANSLPLLSGKMKALGSRVTEILWDL